MHRFIWDLHHPPPDSLDHEYPISAIDHDTPRYPLGAPALPGDYTVNLTVAGKSYRQQLTIQMDPRVKASAQDLAAQFALEAKIIDAMHRSFAAITEVRGLRAQLKDLQKSAAQNVQTAVGELEKKAAELEGQRGGLGATFLSSAQGRGLARLNVGLNNLLSNVDSSDAAPTSQAMATFEEVDRALGEQLGKWNEMRNRDVPALNQILERAGARQIDLHAASASKKIP